MGIEAVSVTDGLLLRTSHQLSPYFISSPVTTGTRALVASVAGLLPAGAVSGYALRASVYVPADYGRDRARAARWYNDDRTSTFRNLRIDGRRSLSLVSRPSEGWYLSTFSWSANHLAPSRATDSHKFVGVLIGISVFVPRNNHCEFNCLVLRIGCHPLRDRGIPLTLCSARNSKLSVPAWGWNNARTA